MAIAWGRRTGGCPRGGGCDAPLLRQGAVRPRWFRRRARMIRKGTHDMPDVPGAHAGLRDPSGAARHCHCHAYRAGRRPGWPAAAGSRASPGG
ncbi:hypothetical protein ACU4GD_21410 [Cupriavidus basilensis]